MQLVCILCADPSPVREGRGRPIIPVHPTFVWVQGFITPGSGGAASWASHIKLFTAEDAEENWSKTRDRRGNEVPADSGPTQLSFVPSASSASSAVSAYRALHRATLLPLPTEKSEGP